MENNEISKARRARGQIAWKYLEEIGGLWPLTATEADTPFAPATFWDGMGEYDPKQVQALLDNAMPHVPAARSWPWIAKAIFNYASSRAIARMLEGSDTDADHVIASIRKHALGLHDAFVALNAMGMVSPYAIGVANWDKADDFRTAVCKLLADAEPNSATNFVVYFPLNLAKMAKLNPKSNENLRAKRTRGITDPNLVHLICDLVQFWRSFKNKKPSCAKPSRHDDGDGPFVRLVDGCVRLAGGFGATRKQVETILKNTP